MGVIGKATSTEVWNQPPPQAVILLLSDTEDDYCTCSKVSKQYMKHVPPMKCTDDILTCTDCDIHTSAADSATQSSTNPSSSEYVRTEEESNTETEDEMNLKRVSISEPAKSKRGMKPGGQYRGTTANVQNEAAIMESSKNEKEFRVTRSRKDTTPAAIQRHKKVNSKKPDNKQGDEGKTGRDSHGRNVRRKKAAAKDPSTLQGKKKGKRISPAVVDAVLGNLQKYVPDVDELRRKRDEDALKCGRITRMVGDASKKTFVHNEMAIGTEEKDLFMNTNTDPPHESPNCNASSTRNNLPTDDPRVQSRAGIEGIVEVRYAHNHSMNKDFILQHGMLTTDASYNMGYRNMVDISMRKEKDLHGNSRHPQPVVDPTVNTQIASPTTEKGNNRSNIGRKFCPAEAHQRNRDRSYDSMHNSGEVHGPNRVDDNETWRRRHSRSRSPTYEERGSQQRRDYDVEENTSPLHARMHRGAQEKTGKEIDQCVCRGRTNLSCSDSRDIYRRSLSPGHNRDRRRGSQSCPRSRSPSMALVRQSPEVVEAQDSRERFQSTQDVKISFEALDRRSRRYKQSVRESQKVQRQREGKKPFYLTVSREGTPYGPGRPAWIAQINKLAVDLDPSCTDIRKQTHRDICMFKDRLNEKFEYSRDLNEDILRGFMGKAVTRRRTDLINLIKKGGDRPLNVDEDDWDRLKMLATSEQRERKTEHGRYANACRRTLGRTGALGEDGVRERLRDLHGRSPDPDEVAEEMQRDKGFGKKKVGTSAVCKQHGKECLDDAMQEDETTFESRSIQLQRFTSDDYEHGKEKSDRRVPNVVLKRKEALVEKHSDLNHEGSDVRTTNTDRDVLRKMSKEDYIARLEAELECLRGDAGKASSSTRAWSSHLGVTAEKDNIELLGGYAG